MAVFLPRHSRRYQVSWQLERRVLSVLRVADSGRTGRFIVLFLVVLKWDCRALHIKLTVLKIVDTSASCSKDQVD